MSLSDIRGRERGTLEFLLGVEGISRAFTTSTSATETWSVNGWTAIKGCLRRQDLRFSQSVNPATAELSAGGMSFRLVDCEYGGAKYAISSLMTGLQAALVTRLTATLDVGDASAAVESSAAFAASGDAYCELETIGYSAKADGTHLGAALTRGKYGSKEVAHTFSDVADDETMADFACHPEVTDRPVSWYGRRVWLFAAEVLSDGTLDTPEQIWRGRITGEVTCEGMEWTVPCESLWDALATEILTGQAVTEVAGLLLQEDVTVGVFLDSEADTQNTGFVVPAGSYYPNDLWAVITELLNDALDALVGVDERFEFSQDSGRIMARLTAPAAPAVYVVALGFDTDINVSSATLAAACGATPAGGWIELATVLLPSADNLFHQIADASSSVVAISLARETVVPVKHAEDFTAWVDAGDTYRTESIVTIDGTPFLLRAVDVGANTLTVAPFTDRIDGPSDVAMTAPSDSTMVVRAGVWLRGTLPLMWRDGFLDNDNVPLAMRAGLDSRDIDWTDLEGRFMGGAADERDHLITEGVSFRELLQADFRWSGLVPIIENGLVTARPIANTGLVSDGAGSLLVIDSSNLRADDQATLTFSPTRVVNRIVFKSERKVGRPFGHRIDRGEAAPFELTITVNDKQSQGRYRLINGSEFSCGGVAQTSEPDIAAYAQGLASSILSLCARDYPTAKVGCLGSAGAQLPMASCWLTHWLLPSHLQANTRGVLGGLALVTGVDVDWAGYSVDLQLRLLTDGAARSGFAPAARIDTYTDNGGGAGDLRYELLLDVGHYSTITDEGGTFGVGTKVVLRQWDVDAITASAESFTLTEAVGNLLYLDSAPSAAMQAAITAGQCVAAYDLYDTAGQTAHAQYFLHVADATDNLIGTSGVLGFQLG